MRTFRVIATAMLFTVAMPAFAANFTSIRFDHTGQFQLWTVPKKGLYSIEAWGASGGPGFFFNPSPTEIVDSVGGRGIGVRDWVFLNKGQVLTIAVGGAGQGDQTRMSDAGGGGGGGSFVGRIGFNEPLVIAGGGGGGGYQNVTPASGGDAIFGIGPRNGGVCDNGNGQGGAGGYFGGGGGGGWCSDGLPGYYPGTTDPVFGEGGGGYLTIRNLQGGAGAIFGDGFPGGFGGGGGGGLCAGGGGGGYAGGRGGDHGICDGMGGGGGSSFASLNARLLGYAPLYQNGWVVISSVPEPGTWALLITGFGLTGAAMRRRRSAAAT